jgi:hypothetical protein
VLHLQHLACHHQHPTGQRHGQCGLIRGPLRLAYVEQKNKDCRDRCPIGVSPVHHPVSVTTSRRLAGSLGDSPYFPSIILILIDGFVVRVEAGQDQHHYLRPLSSSGITSARENGGPSIQGTAKERGLGEACVGV